MITVLYVVGVVIVALVWISALLTRAARRRGAGQIEPYRSVDAPLPATAAPEDD